jgi:hypothetical protein
MEGNRCAKTSMLSKLAEPKLVSTVPLYTACVALTASVERFPCSWYGDEAQPRIVRTTIIAPDTNWPFGYSSRQQWRKSDML